MPSALLADAIDATPWIDTHEHLVAERHRLGDRPWSFTDTWGVPECIPSDWTALIVHYALDDLLSAGLPAAAAHEIRFGDGAPLDRWAAVEPYYEAARATGYLRAVDVTTERLFGLRLRRDTCEEIDARCRELRTPGYYAHVLRDVAGVERCQVHSLEVDPFCETDDPGLLQHDLSLVPLVLGRDEQAERASGIEVATLDDYLAVVEWAFQRYADRAVAVKSPWAYFRPLAVADGGAPPRRAFARLRRGVDDRHDRRRVEDFLFSRSVELAAERRLPVKLHLGYLAGVGRPQFGWVERHVTDVVPLLQRHKDATFVLMHMAWPQQEQLLAVAKHHPNAVVDLCWAWIVSPLATGEFVERFITTVPATKLLCFGGDYMTVENVVGHAEIARRGLQRALERLVAIGWLAGDAALALVPALMRGNAERIFGLPQRTG